MQVFEHGKIRVECGTTSRRDGFNHRAKLYYDGIYIRKDICQYYNRTWEKFSFCSVLNKVMGRDVVIPAVDKINFADKYNLSD